MTKLFCDRCGVEDNEDHSIRKVALSTAPVSKVISSAEYIIQVKRDLCKSCFSDVQAFFGNKP